MSYPTVTKFLGLFLMATSCVFADVTVKYRVQANLISPPSRDSASHACPVAMQLPQTGDIVTLAWNTDKARLDRPDVSTILRGDRGRLYLLFHGPRKYASLEYPILHKNYRLPIEDAVGVEMLRYRIEALSGPEDVRFLGRSAKRYSAAVVNGLRNEWRAAFILTTDVPSDPSLALALRASLHELRFGGNGWLGLLPLEGRLPLVWEEAKRQPETEALYREEATAIEQRALPPETFAIPSDYIKIDYDPLCMRTP